MDDIKKVCSTEYTAAHNSGLREIDAIKWVVLHATEGLTAESSARWFADPRSTGSTHLVLDDNECFRTLRNVQIPWGAKGANTAGFHIEQAGYAKWTREEWLKHDRMLRRCAFKIAIHAYLFDIPLRWVGPIGLKAGLKGLTLHRDVVAAFGGDHTCPGPNYPKAKVLGYSRAYLAEYEAERDA